MTLEFKSVSTDMLETLIESVEETLELTESSESMIQYARATGKCRGTLMGVLSVLRMYHDDEVFSLK